MNTLCHYLCTPKLKKQFFNGELAQLVERLLAPKAFGEEVSGQRHYKSSFIGELAQLVERLLAPNAFGEEVSGRQHYNKFFLLGN